MPETYIILLSTVTPVNSIKKKDRLGIRVEVSIGIGDQASVMILTSSSSLRWLRPYSLITKTVVIIANITVKISCGDFKGEPKCFAWRLSRIGKEEKGLCRANGEVVKCWRWGQVSVWSEQVCYEWLLQLEEDSAKGACYGAWDFSI